jgi:hypothetical protein
MRDLLSRLAMLNKDQKRFWLPTLFGVGVAIICLGLSIIEPIGSWVGYFDIMVGFGLLYWAVRWAKAI